MNTENDIVALIELLKMASRALAGFSNRRGVTERLILPHFDFFISKFFDQISDLNGGF